jgi:hypothetical protein
VIAQKSSAHTFLALSEGVLNALKGAIEIMPEPEASEKKAGEDEHHYARDNAIAALGKVIKYQ